MRALVSEGTSRLAGDLVETREIDQVLVVGKTEPQRIFELLGRKGWEFTLTYEALREPQRIFELLGRKGEVVDERLAPRDAFPEALGAYRRKNWDEARAGFEYCLKIMPGDGPSTSFLRRIGQFCTTAPDPGWDGVWSLAEK